MKADWKPIADAPKDGTEILGWRKDYGILIVHWDSAESFMTASEIEDSEISDDDLYCYDWFCADFVCGCRLEGSEVPTHWDYLPDGPE
jgi:hypothetical protein